VGQVLEVGTISGSFLKLKIVPGIKGGVIKENEGGGELNYDIL
jgi:hypothetical protein